MGQGGEVSLGDAVGYSLGLICSKVVTLGDTRGCDTSGTQDYLVGFIPFKPMNRENDEGNI